jgi:hypothetical protein
MVVWGVVVGGAEDGGAGGAGSGPGAGCAGAGCGFEGESAAGGSLSTAGALGAGARGVGPVGGATDGGAGTPDAVVGGVFTSDCAGSSPILSTAVTAPKPTSRAATHASGTITARFPITRKRWCVPPVSSAAFVACPSVTSSSAADSADVKGWVVSPTGVGGKVAPEACTVGGFRMRRGA